MTIAAETIYGWSYLMGRIPSEWEKLGTINGKAEALRDIAIREGNTQWTQMAIEVIKVRESYVFFCCTMVLFFGATYAANLTRRRKICALLVPFTLVSLLMLGDSMVKLDQAVLKVRIAAELLIAKPS